MRPQLRVSLPSQIPVEKFERVVMTAVNLTPALASADRRSLFNACTKCATDGLLPDGREAALVVFGNVVTYMPMVFGIIKKLRQSGEIASISARLVYENELKAGLFKFAIEDGEEKLSHAPMLIGDRGKPALAYATARFKDGTVQNEVMTLADIEKVRSVSRSKNSGPWTQWWDEMARKTVVRRLSKYLPLSAEDMRVLDADHEETEFDAMKEAAKRAEPQSIEHAAMALSAPATIDVGDGERTDAETGEIHDAETVETVTATVLEIPQREGGGNDWPAYFHAAQDHLRQAPSAAYIAAWFAANAENVKAMGLAKKTWPGELEHVGKLRAAEINDALTAGEGGAA